MIDKKINLIKEWDEIWIDEIVRLEVMKETRSQAQNRLYWDWLWDLTKCFLDKGIFITSEILHVWMSTKLIKWTYSKNPITWQRTLTRKSTKKLNKKEFSEYLKNIEYYLQQTYDISFPMATDPSYNLFINN